MMKKPPFKRHDMGFDLDGRPLSWSPNDVRHRVMAAFDDPDSELVAVVLRHKGDLLLQILGPPSRETLADIKRVLQQLIDGYQHILNDIGEH
jgi:hypothetical protein